MIRLRYLSLFLIQAALYSTIIAPLPVITSIALAQGKAESVRPEVGKPLQAAQDFLKAKKYKEAAAKVRDAENVAGKTPYENYIIERMRGAVAAGSGDTEAALKSYEAVIASGKLPAAEQLPMVQAVASMYYRANNYAKAAQWTSRYLKEGGTDPQMRTLLAQSYYQSGDCASANKELQTELQADEKAGRTPSEERLQLLANCSLKQNDNAGYASALEKLVTYYPKKDYWLDLINRIQRKPGYADRLSLDIYRLKLATGNLTAANDYMEMTQLALEAGYAAEAKKVVDQGFASGVLGAGTGAERQKRLRDLVMKQLPEVQKTLAQNETEAAAQKDGTDLVNVGYAYVNNGQFDKGVALMEQGIRKGGLKRPEDAKLHLGIAYLLAGQKAKAQQMFKTVQGADGTAELARLWAINARRAAA